jgi:flagellar export protein FliJ
MKSLHTLLKVAQRKLDELGVEAAKIGAEIAELQARENAVLAREQAELANAARDPTFAGMLPAYRMRVKQQVAELRAQLKVKQDALDEVRQRLSEAYIEKSKFEQLLDQADLRAATERATREQAQLDEVAINRAGGQGK